MLELLDFPQEILQDVFIRLECADLKNVRLTCKTFGDLGVGDSPTCCPCCFHQTEYRKIARHLTSSHNQLACE
jgi:hypothetical protein